MWVSGITRIYMPSPFMYAMFYLEDEHTNWQIQTFRKKTTHECVVRWCAALSNIYRYDEIGLTFTWKIFSDVSRFFFLVPGWNFFCSNRLNYKLVQTRYERKMIRLRRQHWSGYYCDCLFIMIGVQPWARIWCSPMVFLLKTYESIVNGEAVSRWTNTVFGQILGSLDMPCMQSVQQKPRHTNDISAIGCLRKSFIWMPFGIVKRNIIAWNSWKVNLYKR